MGVFSSVDAERPHVGASPVWLTAMTSSFPVRGPADGTLLGSVKECDHLFAALLNAAYSLEAAGECFEGTDPFDDSQVNDNGENFHDCMELLDEARGEYSAVLDRVFAKNCFGAWSGS